MLLHFLPPCPRPQVQDSSHPATPSALEACAEPGWLAFRAIDAFTGAPLRDARLDLVTEEAAPTPGAFRFVREIPCDADGFAAVPAVEAKDLWLVVRAPGHGPSSQMSWVPGLVWPLAPALDVPVELRDWLDHPVPHASVGFCVGCGHTPDVAWAEADEHGIAVVPGIDPYNDIADFYPDAPGLGLDDYGGVRWVPGDPPAIVRASWAAATRGIVLDPAGAPVGDAVVGVKTVHRGPWTRTRADGTFQLNGATGDELYVMRSGEDDHEYLFVIGDEHEVTLRLPVADGRAVQVIEPEVPETTGRLHVTLRDADGHPLARTKVATIGPRPSQRQRATLTDDAGLAELDLPSGVHELRVPEDRFEPGLGVVEVRPETSVETTRTPTLRPTVRVEAPPDCQVSLLHDGEISDVTKLVAAGSVPVPSTGTVAIALLREHERRVVVLSADDLRHEPVVKLRFLAPTRVSAHLVDAARKPVEATVALLERDVLADPGFDLRSFEGERCADGRLALEARAEGTWLLAVRPERGDLRPRLLPVVLPRRSDDAQVDLGELVLDAEPRLRVVNAGAGGTPGLLRFGWCDVRESLLRGALDANGGWLGLEPREGDVLFFPGDSWDLGGETDAESLVIDVPCRARLDGPGPWTVTVPGGMLELEVRDEAGAPLPAIAFVADRSLAFPGRALLRGLPPGPLEVLVAAEGRRAARATVEVPASGHGSLTLALPRR